VDSHRQTSTTEIGHIGVTWRPLSHVGSLTKGRFLTFKRPHCAEFHPGSKSMPARREDAVRLASAHNLGWCTTIVDLITIWVEQGRSVDRSVYAARVKKIPGGNGFGFLEPKLSRRSEDVHVSGMRRTTANKNVNQGERLASVRLKCSVVLASPGGFEPPLPP